MKSYSEWASLDVSTQKERIEEFQKLILNDHATQAEQHEDDLE